MKKQREYSLEGTIATLFFVALILVVLLQILGRTNLVAGPVWTEEVAPLALGVDGIFCNPPKSNAKTRNCAWVFSPKCWPQKFKAGSICSLI